MPEITITSPVALNLETKKGKKYWLVKQDGEEKGYFIWGNDDQGKLVKQAEENGQAIVIVVDDMNASYPEVTEVRGPVNGNGDTPAPRTTVHQSSGSDLLGKAVNTALMQAVQTTQHTISKDMTPKDIAARVLPLASSYLLWLKERNGIETTPDDIPF